METFLPQNTYKIGRIFQIAQFISRNRQWYSFFGGIGGTILLLE